MATTTPATRSRLGRAAVSTGITSALIGAALGAVALASTANAEEVPESPELVEGNVTTCEAAGLEGEILAGQGDGPGEEHDGITWNISDDGTRLFVTEAGFELTISGTVVKGGPDANVWHGDPEQYTDGMYSPPNGGKNMPAISHWYICGEEDHNYPKICEDAGLGGVLLEKWYVGKDRQDPTDDVIDPDDPRIIGHVSDDRTSVSFEFTEPELIITGVILWADRPDEEWKVIEGKPEGPVSFDPAKPLKKYFVCGMEPTPTPTVEPTPTPTPTEEPTPTPTPTVEPTPTPSASPTEEPEIGLSVLSPVCDNDVPYLEYEVDASEFPDLDDVTITWVNPEGDDVVYEDQPLSGRVLWAGAEVDEDGNPVDWPGWRLEDGVWVEGDEFDWVRPSVEVLFEVNPDITVTVDYPPSSPLCNANPPGEEPSDGPSATPTPDEPGLPDTGVGTGAAMGAMILIAGGAVLTLYGRRVSRQSI